MKSLFKVVVGIYVAITFYWINNVFADVIPENSHGVTTCVRITNLDAYPNLTLIGYSEWPMNDQKPYVIKQNECLTKGYKLNTFTIIAVQDTNVNLDDISPESVFTDPQALSNIHTPKNDRDDLYLNSKYVTNDNPLIKTTTDYAITKMEGAVVLYRTRVKSEYNNGTAAYTETFTEPQTKDVFRFFDSIGHRYQNAINFIGEQNIVQGYSNGSYVPYDRINRAEFLKIVLNSKKISAIKGESSCFPDVTEEWHIEYICTAKKLGIINGYSNGTFRPRDYISFIEALKIINKAYGIKITDSTPWYKAYVNDASTKLLIPIDIGSLNQSINRGQMADLITRFIKLQEGEWTLRLYLKESFGSAGLKQIPYDQIPL